MSSKVGDFMEIWHGVLEGLSSSRFVVDILFDLGAVPVKHTKIARHLNTCLCMEQKICWAKLR